MRRRELSTSERRRLTELAFLRLATPDDDIFDHVLRATIPDVCPPERDLMRALFSRARQPLDLRDAGPAFRTVPIAIATSIPFRRRDGAVRARAPRAGETPAQPGSLDRHRRDDLAPGLRKRAARGEAVRGARPGPADSWARPRRRPRMTSWRRSKAAVATQTDLVPGRLVEDVVIDVPLRERSTPVAPDRNDPSPDPRPPLGRSKFTQRFNAKWPSCPRTCAKNWTNSWRPHVTRAPPRDDGRSRELECRGAAAVRSRAYSARLSRSYRVLFDLHPDHVLVRRVNKGQIHGN